MATRYRRGISREARVSRISRSGGREGGEGPWILPASSILSRSKNPSLQGLTSPARIRCESREPRGDRKVSTETSARRSSFFRAFVDRGSLETELWPLITVVRPRCPNAVLSRLQTILSNMVGRRFFSLPAAMKFAFRATCGKQAGWNLYLHLTMRAWRLRGNLQVLRRFRDNSTKFSYNNVPALQNSFFRKYSNSSNPPTPFDCNRIFISAGKFSDTVKSPKSTKYKLKFPSSASSQKIDSTFGSTCIQTGKRTIYQRCEWRKKWSRCTSRRRRIFAIMPADTYSRFLGCSSLITSSESVMKRTERSRNARFRNQSPLCGGVWLHDTRIARDS